MYRDDLQAAYAKADAAEQRAEKAEYRAALAEKKLSNAGRETLLRPFKKVWEVRGFIFGVVVVLACIFGVAKCFQAIDEDDRRTAIYKSCLTTHCYHKCKDKSLVTSTWKWVHQDSVLSCTCYLKEGKKLLNLRIPIKCADVNYGRNK
jgi:hypothetical protein